MLFVAVLFGFHATFCIAIVVTALRWRKNPDPAGINWSDLTVYNCWGGRLGFMVFLCCMAGIFRVALLMSLNSPMGSAVVFISILLVPVPALPALGWKETLRRRGLLMAILAAPAGLMTGLISLAVFFHLAD